MADAASVGGVYVSELLHRLGEFGMLSARDMSEFPESAAAQRDCRFHCTWSRSSSKEALLLAQLRRSAVNGLRDLDLYTTTHFGPRLLLTCIKRGRDALCRDHHPVSYRSTLAI
jgi:hypothetical protein